ncbi:MAG: hypothetical protein DRZ80_04485 [Thermoprotei archaeon]|nr:MAG: hypothetical protein DRZ80_04485 [Thermoprotei archaeon]
MLARKRKSECKKFLKFLKDGRIDGIVTDFTVHSIIVLMDHFKKLDKLKVFLSSLRGYKGLHVYTTSLMDELNAVDIALENGLDMDDAIQYAVALKFNVKAIVSFDRHFDDLKIPRLEPSKLRVK